MYKINRKKDVQQIVKKKPTPITFRTTHFFSSVTFGVWPRISFFLRIQINRISDCFAGAGIKDRNAKADATGSRWEHQKASWNAAEQGNGWVLLFNNRRPFRNLQSSGILRQFEISRRKSLTGLLNSCQQYLKIWTRRTFKIAFLWKRYFRRFRTIN